MRMWRRWRARQPTLTHKIIAPDRIDFQTFARDFETPPGCWQTLIPLLPSRPARSTQLNFDVFARAGSDARRREGEHHKPRRSSLEATRCKA